MSQEANWPRTHRVAVGAYIFRGDRVLLVKRRNPPLTFAPPGGKLHVDEDPVAGLRREVRE
ncbi:MAG: NUDIX domain-containing protein, partial [bacterium]|nr:NUDIX domain-containing protein [bacterium]